MSSILTSDFSREVWYLTYKYREEKSIEDTFARNAVAIASVEKESIREYWTSKFEKLLNNLYLCPAGRILANAGTHYKGVTLFNCYVGTRPTYDIDSIDGILETLRVQAQTLKSEGGWGMNFSFIRPRGSLIGGIGVESPGAVKYMELFNKSSDIITAGSGKEGQNSDINAKKKIRKGAQMGMLCIWHPDIAEFIKAKRIPNKLDKFNVSIAADKLFMDAVVRVEETGKDEEWNLLFPDTTFSQYKEEWDGNLYRWIDKGYPVKKWESVSVSKLWDLVMRSTYDFNDPGIFFVDVANATHLFNYDPNKYILATNPCVAKGTLVNTPAGYRKVEDIKEGDFISTVLGSEPVKTIEINKDYPIFKIKFSDGGEQFVTPNHQYHTIGDGISKKVILKKVKHLKIGDKLRIVPTQLNIPDNHINDDYYDGVRTGLLLGDGCYTQKCLDGGGCSISCNSDEELYNNRVKEIFGVDNFKKDQQDKNSKSLNLCFRKHSLTPEILNRLNLAECHDKSIDITNLNNISKIIGILDGILSTDGNVNLKSNHPQLRWFTSSYQLAQDIRNLLLYIGCHGFITESFDKGGSINGREIVRKHIKHTITISGESFRQYAKITGIENVNIYKYDRIKEALINYRLSGNCWMAKVVSIEEYGVADVYDLYCEKSDTWITSGYVQLGCGEQSMPFGSVCDLGSIILPTFYSNGIFDYNLLQEQVKIAVRFLDNVNDYSETPHEDYTKSARNNRRIGLGIMGWGSLLYLMKIRYGSDEAERIKKQIMLTFTQAAVSASVELACEKGMFVGCDKEAVANHPFWDQIELPDELRQLIRKHGLRNSSLFSIQPTGNTGCLINLISGGCEPVYLHDYIRTVIVQSPPEYIKDLCPKYWEGEFHETELFKLVKEGQEDILRGEYNGVVYKIDKNRGLTKEVLCEDYGVKKLRETGEWDDNANWAATTDNLNIEDHIKDLTGWSKWIDASISKTINVPHNYPYEDFKKIYLETYKAGTIKGITTYRSGTMATVLSSSKKNVIVKNNAPKRPRTLPAKVFYPTLKGQKYYVVAALLEGDLYEVFAGKLQSSMPHIISDGEVFKVRRGHYRLVYDGSTIIDNLIDHCDPAEESICRLLSAGLRHGADLKFLIEQLNQSKGDLHSFGKVLSRTIKRFIPENTRSTDSCPSCGQEEMRYVEGCKMCLCGWSKC